MPTPPSHDLILWLPFLNLFHAHMCFLNLLSCYFASFLVTLFSLFIIHSPYCTHFLFLLSWFCFLHSIIHMLSFPFSFFLSLSFLSPSSLLSLLFLSSYPFFNHPFSHAHARSFYHDGMPTPCLVPLPSSQVLWPCAFSYIPMLGFVHKLFLVHSHFFCATSIFSPHTVSFSPLLECFLSWKLSLSLFTLSLSSTLFFFLLLLSHTFILTCNHTPMLALSQWLFLAHTPFLTPLLPYSLSYAPSHDPTPLLATLCPFLWPCSHTFSCPCM